MLGEISIFVQSIHPKNLVIFFGHPRNLVNLFLQKSKSQIRVEVGWADLYFLKMDLVLVTLTMQQSQGLQGGWDTSPTDF